MGYCGCRLLQRSPLYLVRSLAARGVADRAGSGGEYTRTPFRRASAFLPRFLVSALILTAVSLTSGCGSGSSGSQPAPAGNTQVTVMVSGTANDQLADSISVFKASP